MNKTSSCRGVTAVLSLTEMRCSADRLDLSRIIILAISGLYQLTAHAGKRAFLPAHFFEKKACLTF